MITLAPPAIQVVLAVLTVGGAMAAHAVGRIADALLAMLRRDLGGPMFVAPKAGVGAVLAVHMAGGAGGVVRRRQAEPATVFEVGGCPVPGRVALSARATCVSMDCVSGRSMAVRTTAAKVRPQKGVVEALRDVACQARTGMVGVAGRAVPGRERLVEGRTGPGDRRAFRGPPSDVLDGVALLAALAGDTPEGRVAGEAILLQGVVRRDQVAGAHHLMRANEHERYDRDERRRDG